MWVSADSYLAEISARRVEEAARRDHEIAAIRRMYETARNYEERGYSYYVEQMEQQQRARRRLLLIADHPQFGK